jgi:hypothetical protein
MTATVTRTEVEHNHENLHAREATLHASVDSTDVFETAFRAEEQVKQQNPA